jgi:hypothetical protein
MKNEQSSPAPEERYICSKRLPDQTTSLQRSVIFVANDYPTKQPRSGGALYW